MREKLGTMWDRIITPIKFGWYSIWAYFGLKYGKEGLEALTREKAEKLGEKAKEAVEEKKEDLKEKNTPLAVLSTAGLGIFGAIKSKLPKSIADKIDTADKNGFLKSIAQNRALRLFGIPGIALLGFGQLAHATENPKIQAEIGKMPQEPEKQKIWWKNLIEKTEEMSGKTKDALKKFFAE